MPSFDRISPTTAAVWDQIIRRNALGAVECPADPNAPCWCRSGEPWNECHRHRAELPELSIGQLDDLCRRDQPRMLCRHPAASGESCSSLEAIGSHTIQRNGGLTHIAENSHVYSSKRSFERIAKNAGKVTLEPLGIRQASVFPGFCSRHDKALFDYAEHVDSPLDLRSCYLLSLRAAAFELSTKETQIRLHRTKCRYVDQGMPFEAQSRVQNLMWSWQEAMELGRRDIFALSNRYMCMYDSEQDPLGLSVYAIRFDQILPLAASGAFAVEVDFDGRRLHDLRSSVLSCHVALNIAVVGRTTCMVLAWFGGRRTAAAALVESFKRIPDERKASAATVLAMEHLENFFCRPSWWDGLRDKDRQRLDEKIAGGLHEDRHADALVEPDLHVVTARVLSTFEFDGG